MKRTYKCIECGHRQEKYNEGQCLKCMTSDVMEEDKGKINDIEDQIECSYLFPTML